MVPSQIHFCCAMMGTPWKILTQYHNQNIYVITAIFLITWVSHVALLLLHLCLFHLHLSLNPNNLSSISVICHFKIHTVGNLWDRLFFFQPAQSSGNSSKLLYVLNHNRVKYMTEIYHLQWELPWHVLRYVSIELKCLIVSQPSLSLELQWKVGKQEEDLLAETESSIFLLLEMSWNLWSSASDLRKFLKYPH